MRSVVAALALALPLLPATASAAEAATTAEDAEPSFVVLRENGTGSAAAAEPFVAEMLGVMYGLAAWGEPVFQYFTDRSKAKTWIDASKPTFGILTFPAYVGLHDKYGYTTIGEAEAAGSGGGQYYIISREAHDLAGCKGKTLATNHADDGKFVTRVLSGGAFSLSDFELVTTTRPVQTLKKVTRGEAVCALIDHAQFEALQKLEGHEGIETVWFSRSFTSYVVVAFKSATKAEVATLRDKLDEVCTGDGKAACGRAGVTKLAPVKPDAFAADVAAYEKS